jgi:uncharacterized membrane protein
VDFPFFYHSFMLDSNGITVFDPPQCHPQSGAYGINAEGTIVGSCFPGGPYIRTPDGTFSIFNITDTSNPLIPAVAINVTNLVTGSHYSESSLHGYVGRPNSQVFFDPPGSVWTQPTSINSVGAVTGWYRDGAGVSHGFVRGPLGKIVSFDPAGSTWTVPAAINDAGAIVGSHSDANGGHGFVRNPFGKITAIDPPGSTDAGAADINDAGVIVGSFSTDGGKTYAGFVRTP